MKIGPIEFTTYFGDHNGEWSKFLTKLVIGRLRLHFFWRGDGDADPHDHRADFWTFPLRGYGEHVWFIDRESGEWLYRYNYVKPFRLHYRPAHYAHRVLDRPDGRRIITLSWWARPCREWGFWKVYDPKQCWMPWKEYLDGGGKGDACQ